MAREKFASQRSFILTSIGAAVGLGNALRFPGLCAKYGGGAFLLIYAVALVVLGLPLLSAEIALGRKTGGGAPQCMKSLSPKAEKIGWSQTLNSVATAIIYAGLAGWLITTVVTIVPLTLSADGLSQSKISNYFFTDVLHSRDDGRISSFSLPVLGGIAVAWVFMFFCLKNGAKSLSKAAKFTVVIPVVLLSALAVRGLLYENSSSALAALFVPDFSALSSPQLWLSALGQVFFSLSIVVGIMPVYGSYLPSGANVFSCSLAIAAADFFVSVLAAVVLFTTLYGCGIEGSVSPSGIITAFSVYPVAISRLFGGAKWLNAAVGVLFYSSLSMMAVQSAVSMLEAFCSPFSAFSGVPKKRIALIICLCGFALSLVFCTDAARVAVEIGDRFVNFYDVLLLGIAQCLVLRKSNAVDNLCGEVNKFARHICVFQRKNGAKNAKIRNFSMPPKFFSLSLRVFSPVILIALAICEVVRIFARIPAVGGWQLFAYGWGISLLVLAAPYMPWRTRFFTKIRKKA